ncbi:MAG: hypothetical protein KJ556_15100 [Gammaproteobacteria bacterium]|nr:hypothetical protein [Gammaproteobacteria bacterium]MBU2058239.1 hypothetical protein [Gammaproteobacteria bacterium]MBU2176447.1 hypothetical protein [Gammaproteobacteria bacterium]MBU2246380.1 hypothetical protein [Gammaproteobacteria bacterium]MBU2345461.1 hypothetical protein [Gammaproteobacteria bacterium]
MKHLALWVFIIFCCAATPSQATEATSLQGSWTLQSAVYTKADGTVIKLSADDLKSVKILSKGHFSFVTVNKDGSFSSALTGTYQLKGNDYHETPQTGSVASMLNKTYEFKAELKDNLWLHSGMEDGMKIEEVWVRLD